MAKHVTVGHMAGPMNNRRRIKNPDPNFHYHYANPDNPNRIEDLIEMKGYNVVRKDVTEVDGDSSLDGAVTAGGDVLMRCPTPVWEARQKQLREETARFTLGPAATFKNEGDKADVQTFDHSKRKVGPMKDVLSGS
jgi:hypothetical protein